MAKNLLLALFVALFTLGIVELAVGYRAFRESTRQRLMIADIVRKGMPALVDAVKNKGFDLPQHYTYFTATESNPFVDQEITAHRFHPLIGFTGFYGKRGIGEIRRDYFGFRNKEDLYFDSPEKRDYRLVVLTGGSEAAGYSHRIPISEHLERLLNEKRKAKYRVLNLSMCGYTMSDEINAYVQLAYSLKPEMVISISGYNDMLNGMMAPPKFKELGLIYFHQLEHWMPRLYDLKDTEEGRVASWAINEKNSEKIVDGFFKTLARYKGIVQGGGSKFYFVVQTNQESIPKEESSREVYTRTIKLMDDLRARAQKQGALALKGLTLIDTAHTTEESSLLAAKAIIETL